MRIKQATCGAANTVTCDVDTSTRHKSGTARTVPWDLDNANSDNFSPAVDAVEEPHAHVLKPDEI